MAEQQAGPEVSAAPGLLWFGASGFNPHSFGICMVGFPYRVIHGWPAWQGSCCAWGTHTEASVFIPALPHAQTS